MAKVFISQGSSVFFCLSRGCLTKSLISCFRWLGRVGRASFHDQRRRKLYIDQIGYGMNDSSPKAKEKLKNNTSQLRDPDMLNWFSQREISEHHQTKRQSLLIQFCLFLFLDCHMNCFMKSPTQSHSNQLHISGDYLLGKYLEYYSRVCRTRATCSSDYDGE